MRSSVRLHANARRSPPRAIAIAAVLVGIGCQAAVAHEGPPFPILVDRPVAGYLVSVWADPDIGEARFYVIVESQDDGNAVSNDTLAVSLWTEPENGRLPRAHYAAKPSRVRHQRQFEAEPYFDRQDLWRVGVQLAGPNGAPGELVTSVESTPPGYGPLDLVIYLFPFVLLGVFWMLAMVRRSRIRRESCVDATLIRPPCDDIESATTAEQHAIGCRGSDT